MGLVGPGSPYQPTRSPGDSLQHIPTAESNSEFGRCWDSNDSTTQRSPLAESSWRKRSRRASSKSASSGIGKQRCRNSGVQRSPLDHITGTQNGNPSQPRLLPSLHHSHNPHPMERIVAVVPLGSLGLRAGANEIQEFNSDRV